MPLITILLLLLAVFALVLAAIGHQNVGLILLCVVVLLMIALPLVRTG